MGVCFRKCEFENGSFFFFILNHLILAAKLFIYKCKLSNTYQGHPTTI